MKIKHPSRIALKAIIFLRHHLHDELNKNEYLLIKDPLTLWNNLREKYKYQKIVILPKRLLLLDAPEVTLFKISSQLKLCGEKVTDVDMLEKMYTTFHASNVLLQQQYREHKFTRYSELISCLLVAEQNNELLMKNYQSRPTSFTPFPEANKISFCGNKGNHYRGRGRKYIYIYIYIYI
jgi:predicted PolB exonuclease-like 3'-5' exonuclease